MGQFVNRLPIRVTAFAVTVAIVLLNVLLVYLTITGQEREWRLTQGDPHDHEHRLGPSENDPGGA